MAVVYLLNSGVSAGKDGGRLVVKKEGEAIASVPLQKVEGLIIGRNAQVSTQVLFTFMQSRTPVVYVDGRGRICGTLMDSRESLKRFKWQLSFAENQEKRASLAREILSDKLAAQMELLRYYGRSRKDGQLKAAADEIGTCRRQLAAADDVDTMRGLEGVAASLYFKAFPHFLVDDGWHFPGRVHHPAYDPVNALLNYGYAFLEREVRLALAAVFLSPRIGIIHANNDRRDSLVYDMMEPFRQKVTDRFVVKLLNRHVLHPDDFRDSKKGCRLTPEGSGLWIRAYEKYMETKVSEYGGLTPRAWIRRSVRQMAKSMKEIDEAGHDGVDGEMQVG